MSTQLLAGDRALVTGGGQGIGKGTALALARDGAKVLFADVNEAGGRATEAEARAEGLDCAFTRADLSTLEGARALWRVALDRLGTVSVLVHAASPRRLESDTALDVADDTWDAMMNVNLRAGFELGRAAGRHMRDAAIPGRILYMTSLHAYAPRNLPHYSAAKAGTTMVMKELAKLLGPHGIRVNAIAPGAIPGGGFGGLPGLVEHIPLGRVGTPDDIAQMAVAILSERFGRYVAGTTIAVDGGLALTNWIPAPR